MTCRAKMRLVVNSCCPVIIVLALGFLPRTGLAAEKLVGIHSARTMSQSMPWIAEEVGLFRKYDLDFQLVYIVSASFRRYLDGLEKSGFFGKLWAGK